MPPAWVATMLLARGEWRLPQLDGISDAPGSRTDGAIHDEPGYDPRTRIIFDPRGVAFPPVPAAPTHAHATRALADLLDRIRSRSSRSSPTPTGPRSPRSSCR